MVIRRVFSGRTRGAAGRYRVVHQVLADDTGTVWQAEDKKVARPVTIRSVADSLAADEEFLARHERDVRTVKSLSHPNLATIFIRPLGERGPWRAFVVMEPLIETLRQRIRRKGPLGPLEAAATTADLADGIQAAHEAGVVHGRLSADAVMLTPDGSAKVFDFGFASVRGQRHPEAVKISEGDVRIAVAGSASASATPAEDVHALGAVLFEMLTGRPAIPTASASELREALGGIAEHIADACEHALVGGRSNVSAAELSSALSPEPLSLLSKEATGKMQASFGAVLREYRSRAGLTQGKLATISGLKASLVSQIERGTRSPSLAMLYELADALGARPVEMLEAMDRGRDSSLSGARGDTRGPLPEGQTAKKRPSQPQT
jgi:serine/threonine protein kinase